MSREMFITVGTSLFHSASWDFEGELRSCPSYQDWLKAGYKLSPQARQESGLDSIRDFLRTHLREDNGRQWAGFLPQELRTGAPPPATAMRYSAELATLIKLAALNQPTLKDLLAAYRRIRIVVDPIPGRPLIAAQHLKKYLETCLGSQARGEKGVPRVEALPVDGLSSTEVERLLGSKHEGLQALLARAREATQHSAPECLDFVITGGFKVYGAVLAQAFELLDPTELRLLYIHETGADLMIVGKGYIDARNCHYPLQSLALD